MPRFINIEDVALKGVAVFDENLDLLIPLSDVRKALLMTPTADVAPRAEVDKLEYTLAGVMHSVDKWLDGDELKQDEVNRAITMREKTLRIIENAKSEVDKWIGRCGEWHGVAELKSRRIVELEEKLAQAKAEVAREIFEDLESKIVERNGLYNFPIITHEFIAELKKKYTEEVK